ncbi:MAG: sugar phosphorylase [Lentisphaeraceae bacterium]|nr:sugar phosphorylase [Lentisphaeraceae bacterium]
MDNFIEIRLNRIYSRRDAISCIGGIKNLIDVYKDKIQSKPYSQTEKDIVLIAYGDHISDSGTEEKPLVTLKKFLNKFCKDKINSVHILPFYPYSSDDGFSVIDYKAVDPELGSWKDVNAIGKNYRIMFDGVVNHISAESTWFKKYLENDPEFKDFFHDIDPSTDLSEVVRPRTSPLLTEFKDADGKTKHVWCTFSADQVDLNYSNYNVLLAVLDVLFSYVENGATLIRLDAIAFLWKQPGTNSVHLTQTHELIQVMRDVIHKVAPEVIIITETNVPHSENVSYFGTGYDEAHMVYNFALPPLIAWSIITGDGTRLSEWAKTLELPSDKVCFFNFTASHDGIGMRPVSDILSDEEVQILVDSCTNNGGLVSYRDSGFGTIKPYELNCTFKDLLTSPDEAEEIRMKRMLLSQAIALAIPGVPGIYLSSLLGSENWQEGQKITGINRTLNREKFDWGQLEERFNVAECKKYFDDYLKLIDIRSSEKAFDPYESFTILDLHSNALAILRHGEEPVLCLHSFSNENLELQLPESFSKSSFDMITNKSYSEKCILQPADFVWLKVKEKKCT